MHVTSTDTGSTNDTAASGPPDEGGKHGRRNAILTALIGAVALVAAAVLPLLLTTKEPHPQKDPCDLERLTGFWNQPPSERHNEALFADHQSPRVYTRVSTGSNPEVSVRGRLDLDVPAGQVLYLVRRPDPGSRDQEGHPGNGRYYPVSPVTPTSQGCWEDDARPIGYPGAKGIGQLYLLVLVGQDRAASFTSDRTARDWDGYSPDQWSASNSISVLSFPVSTA
jgi:hypothetical protein